jgi:zinc/manganese transport system permease protein
MDLKRAEAEGISTFWDFLFYASFVVVTSSVSIAGVLLVFCYLIAVGGGYAVRRRPAAGLR